MGTINVCTASTDDKLQDITDQVARQGLTACALQETRRINSGTAVINTSLSDGTQLKYHAYWSGYKRQLRDGVGLLVRADRYT